MQLRACNTQAATRVRRALGCALLSRSTGFVDVGGTRGKVSFKWDFVRQRRRLIVDMMSLTISAMTSYAPLRGERCPL
jgi:hypothetical protein